MTKDEINQLRKVIKLCMDLEDMGDGLYSAAKETFYDREFLQTMRRCARELVDVVDERIDILDKQD